ncbi:hypothetical protein [Candidatus Nanohalobium constans]|uniref:Uncharacterized protein n=1 Tax=Candidatus Nanohalobium constans TaxID=2565781 RepID=A0A5Q0UI10_9ARCH|nr:hypothetical protein [Candidatus Nanohalobium constans]QGA80565.1 hypothetical protein LC1Nh_0674 [Candidatus Nanohalobium constans]
MSGELRFCPNCGSTDVEPDTTITKTIAGIGDVNSWRCSECEYSGPMPQGDPEEDFEENGENIKFEDKAEYSRISTVKQHNLDLVLTIGFILLVIVLLILEKLI